MSIISDALKKAQVQNGVVKKEKTAQTLQVGSDKISKTRTERSWPIIPIAILILVASFFVFNSVGRDLDNSSSVSSDITENASMQIAREETPALKQERSVRIQKLPSSQEFDLSGILFGSGAPFAIINGVVMGIGDEMGDATLVDIEENRVTLFYNNDEAITLNLK